MQALILKDSISHVVPFFLASDGVTPATTMAAAMKTQPIYTGRSGCSVLLVWTGTGSGTITIYETLDPNDTTGFPIPAANLPALAAGQPAGAAGRIWIPNLNSNALYRWIGYVPSGGSGADGALTVTTGAL